MPVRTATERLLVRLEWRVVRRLDGRVAGGYRTAHRGTGTDLVGLREYTEGDDARFIDWNVTARLNEPQIRVFTEDRELTAWLVLDRSASMTVGPPGRGKDDVLSELALVLARLFGRNGNRVGAGRPRTGRPGRTTDLAAMLDAVAKLARRRALIVVISDFIGDGDWGRSLLRLVPRHEVVALRIVDAADDELPDVGLVVVEDAETGEQLVIDSSDPLLRARLRTRVEERDAGLAAGMRRAGVPIHRIGTDADLATALIGVVASTRGRQA
jgi:uncharacterized protein (DUF58 family)